MKVILSDVRPPLCCRMYVIDVRDMEIRWYPADRGAPIKWKAGRHYRTPEEQWRLDRTYTLRKSGLSFSKIGTAMRVSAERARQLYVKAERERQEEIPPFTVHEP